MKEMKEMKKADVCYKGGDDFIVAVINGKQYRAEELHKDGIINADDFITLNNHRDVLYDEEFRSEIGSLERQRDEGRLSFDGFMNAEEELYDSFIDKAIEIWCGVLAGYGYDAIDGGCI